MSQKSFGRLPDGRETHLYTLRNAHGFQADIADYGGTAVRLLAPDRNGKFTDFVLGLDSAAVTSWTENLPEKLANPMFSVGNRPRNAALPGLDQSSSFPTTVLRSGQVYRSRTVYRFSTR